MITLSSVLMCRDVVSAIHCQFLRSFLFSSYCVVLFVDDDQLPTWDDGFALRIGALTIHKLGKLSPETPGSHSKQHVYPAGFLSS